MRTLLLADIHITDESIMEIISIFDNDIYKLQADAVIQLGDLYNKNRPSPNELRFGTRLIKGLVEHYKDVTLLAGNGGHEFQNGVGIIEYLRDLDAKIVTTDHFVKDNVYYGHHMLHESKLEYGTGKCGLKDLAQYKYAILAHQHSFQKFNEKVYHLGSMRYQHFNESSDKCKYVAMLDDDKLEFIPLKRPIKMIDVYSIDELKDVEFESKVRLVISSFDEFKKNISELHKWKNKFKQFKVKLDFEKEVATVEKASTSNKNLEEIIEEGIAKIKDEDVRKLLKDSLK